MKAKVNFKPDLYLRRVRDEVSRALTRQIVLVQRGLVEMLSREGSGVTYRGGRRGKGMERTRSAPGEPPAVDTGALRRSVQVAVPSRRDTPTMVSVRLTDILSYGGMHELGTKTTAKRPWIKPTLDPMKPQINREVNAAVQRALAQRGA